MGDIIKEMCWRPGFECGECGEWVSRHNPLPCGGNLCVKMTEEDSNEPSS